MKQWWKEAVVYQIYPRSFNDSNGDGIGDIPGITEKMSYLAELGIDVIWLSPVYDSPNDDNGYDIRDYRAIMDEFGTMDDFDAMLEEAHRHGIKIMMDLVVNHSSDEHQWFMESRSSKDSPYRDYYIWKKGENGQPPTNWGAFFGGSAWAYDEASDEYYLHLFSKKQPDLNWESETLRREVYDLMAYWLDKGVDGFRMDVINMISKDQSYPDGKTRGTGYGDGTPFFFNGPRIHEFMQEMNREVLSKYDTITVGEMPGVSVDEAKLYTGEDRDELNMVFHFEHVDVGNGSFGKWNPTDWKLTELKTIFSRWQEGLEEEGWNSLYWSNHDQPRAISRFGNDSDEYRVVSGKMLATLLHMLKGTPYIYQGEEFGMTNVAFDSIDKYRDIETLNAYRDYTSNDLLTHEEIFRGIHARGRDNSRTPVQWSADAQGGFTTGTPWIDVNPNYVDVNAEAARLDPNSLFHYYRQLIALRKQNPVVVYGKYELLLPEDEAVYAFTRTLEGETWLVLCNFSAETQERTLPYDVKDRVIGNMEPIEPFTLRPYEAQVYKL
ncbi:MULTISPECIES: alpha-glucosidase [unclassified Exiguobacterium]|uniref:glycoside hydrolase family 13 protein n=1 Tax=unclassified Exiguobacterium TaxID=2644629 RepID=UPI00103FDEDD|nr:MULTISPECIES: alpha-glucosidase [unclassified Exiguobacterium]TCI34524.1 alpha-glucosidase [Exiguobacterium sp. SH4S7]TCI44276.1 alpha-glucosidase [Exiguobacterium sp. SH5S32]TCI50541.1 alpha-glucosidase [Exiguobacterium sp. SH1S4]TCI60598.1 alpha-glucosidase [Exiguobacterium sp. SH0S2]TCI69500.1 alpha-glucosidase [Exiguobacterium sp. SH1S1]